MSSPIIGLLIAAVIAAGFIAARFFSSRAGTKKPGDDGDKKEKKTGDGKQEHTWYTGVLIAVLLLISSNVLFFLFFRETAVAIWRHALIFAVMFQLSVVVFKILRLTPYGYLKWVLYLIIIIGGFIKTTPALLTEEHVKTAIVADIENTAKLWRSVVSTFKKVDVENSNPPAAIKDDKKNSDTKKDFSYQFKSGQKFNIPAGSDNFDTGAMITNPNGGVIEIYNAGRYIKGEEDGWIYPLESGKWNRFALKRAMNETLKISTTEEVELIIKISD